MSLLRIAKGLCAKVPENDEWRRICYNIVTNKCESMKYVDRRAKCTGSVKSTSMMSFAARFIIRSPIDSDRLDW